MHASPPFRTRISNEPLPLEGPRHIVRKRRVHILRERVDLRQKILVFFEESRQKRQFILGTLSRGFHLVPEPADDVPRHGVLLVVFVSHRVACFRKDLKPTSDEFLTGRNYGFGERTLGWFGAECLRLLAQAP